MPSTATIAVVSLSPVASLSAIAGRHTPFASNSHPTSPPHESLTLESSPRWLTDYVYIFRLQALRPFGKGKLYSRAFLK
jgi:hypothetical protein